PLACDDNQLSDAYVDPLSTIQLSQTGTGSYAMKANAGQGQRVSVWLGATCLGLLVSQSVGCRRGLVPSPEGPKPRAILKGHRDRVLSVAFSPEGNTLASGSGDRTIKLWDVATGKERATLTGHGDWVRSVAFSPDGNTLASGSDAGYSDQ